MRTHCVQGEGGGQKLANCCVRTLWMAPNFTTSLTARLKTRRRDSAIYREHLTQKNQRENRVGENKK